MLGTVDARVHDGEGRPVLAADQLRLLRLLAEGFTLGDAARRCHLSRRTAQRRVSEARAALAARTTTQAVVRVVCGGNGSLVHEALLSARERSVLELIAEGLRSAEVAARLGVSRSTVDSLVGTAMSKLDARTRTEAAVRAVRLGPRPPQVERFDL